jgi:uncharacterized membrane protein YqjE
MPSNERSVSDVLQDIVGNIQDIVRSEVRMAKTEVREEIAKATTSAWLVGIGALSGFFGAFFLLLAIVYALSTLVPNWAAALIVTVALSIAASAMLSVGVRRFKQVHPTPDRTIESVKENVEWAKQQGK